MMGVDHIHYGVDYDWESEDMGRLQVSVASFGLA
jgi:hypothetical protein